MDTPATKGKFITFEGGEGTGKTTQIKLLAAFLAGKGIDVLTTKEPGGTEIGAEIRRILLEGKADKMDAVAEALLFYADRRVHLSQKVWPALEAGRWAVSDRFADSTVAYQYYGHGKRVEREVLNGLHKLVAGGFKPDLTFVLDLDPEEGVRRSISAHGREVRFEEMDMGFHRRLRAGFMEIAAEEPERCAVIDAGRSIEEIAADIARTASERLGLP